jgi:hypothetical protein
VKNKNFHLIGLKVAMVFSSCLFSCNVNDIEIKSSDFFELNKDAIVLDTLVLSIDSSTVIPENSQLLENDSTLFFFNKSNLSLEFYDVYSNDFKRIRLEAEGPNGLGGSNGIYFVSNDTIIASKVNNLVLFDINGLVYNRIKLDLDGLGSVPDIMIQGTKPVIKIGNKLIVALFPHLDPSNISNLKKWKSFVEIDLSTGKAMSFGDLPEEMMRNVYGINFLNFSFVVNDKNELVISFAPLNDLFKISLDTEERKLERIPLPNPNFGSASKLPNPSNTEMRYVLSHYLYNPSFEALYFNGENYLRIIQKPISEDEFKSMSWAKEKVLVMYNREFEPIQSIDLNSKSLSYNMIYPLVDGFISRISSNDENKMKFVKIRKK